MRPIHADLPLGVASLKWSEVTTRTAQVFGLMGKILLLSASQHPCQCSMLSFVPNYRCGAVLDFNQIPLGLKIKRPRLKAILSLSESFEQHEKSSQALALMIR